MKLRKISRLIPYCSAMSLLVLGLITLNPICSGNALLSIDGSSNEVYAAENTNTGSSISLVIDGWITSDGNNSNVTDSVTTTELSTAYISHNVTVNVSNAASYSLQLTAASGKTANLVHTDGTVITGADGAKGSELADNTWGYSWGEAADDVAVMNYYTLPNYGTSGTGVSTGRLEYASPNGSASFTKKLTFAAKFGSDVPDGSYSTEALVSLVVDPTEQTVGLGFGGYTTMQEITKAKCDSIASGTEGRLKDTRDNKIYWVAKLPDGLCWMTQNLWYNYGSVGTYFYDSTESTAQYYNPGAYYYETPTNTQLCNTSLTNGLKGCVDKGWQAFDINLLSTEIIEKTAATNMHYSAGNRYNQYAATKGTDGYDSICPDGWKLPIYSSASDKALGSFFYLFSQYGSLNGFLYGEQDIRTAPLYILLGGRSRQNNLIWAGYEGGYWTTVASWGGYNMLLVDNNGVQENAQGSSYLGYSVRCVVR